MQSVFSASWVFFSWKNVPKCRYFKPKPCYYVWVCSGWNNSNQGSGCFESRIRSPGGISEMVRTGLDFLKTRTKPTHLTLQNCLSECTYLWHICEVKRKRGRWACPVLTSTFWSLDPIIKRSTNFPNLSKKDKRIRIPLGWGEEEKGKGQKAGQTKSWCPRVNYLQGARMESFPWAFCNHPLIYSVHNPYLQLYLRKNSIPI